MKADKICGLEMAEKMARPWMNREERWFVLSEVRNEHDLRWLCKRLQPDYNYKIYYNIKIGIIGSKKFFEKNNWDYC